MNRTLGVLAGALLLATATHAQQDFSNITNFLRLNTEVCTGGQPTLDDLARMKADGIRAVLNLRRPSEYDAAGEEAKAKEVGLRYFNIPVNSAEPKDEQAEEFLNITRDAKNRPIFIHCSAANRVGGFWMIRRVLVDGWKLEDAEAEARKIGLRSPMLRQFAQDYIARHKNKTKKR